MTEIAWVTGGGTGIGRAIAEQLYQDGASVIITGRRAEVLETAAKEMRARGGPGKIHTISGDASDPAHVSHVVSDTKSRWGDITLLVNNAGSNSNRHFRTASDEEYESAFQTNCMSAIRTVEAVLPAMRKSGHGAIVNISSVYGRWGTATSASYSVSKFALAGYSEVLRQALVGSGIHVLCVFPGYIKTAMTSPFVKEGTLRSRIGKTPDQMAQAIRSALRSRQVELYFPWYVPWVLRLHRWMPVWADALAMKVKR